MTLAKVPETLASQAERIRASVDDSERRALSAELDRARQEEDNARRETRSLEATRHVLEKEIAALRERIAPVKIPRGCALVLKTFEATCMRTGELRVIDKGGFIAPPYVLFERASCECDVRVVSVSNEAFEAAVTAGQARTM